MKHWALQNSIACHILNGHKVKDWAGPNIVMFSLVRRGHHHCLWGAVQMALWSALGKQVFKTNFTEPKESVIHLIHVPRQEIVFPVVNVIYISKYIQNVCHFYTVNFQILLEMTCSCKMTLPASIMSASTFLWYEWQKRMYTQDTVRIAYGTDFIMRISRPLFPNPSELHRLYLERKWPTEHVLELCVTTNLESWSYWGQ